MAIGRTLYLASPDGDVPVTVSIFESKEGDRCWEAAFLIDWPNKPERGIGRGYDAIQATLIAMQMIAVSLYASAHHEAGRLRWVKPGTGYGFPMPKSGRENLIGDDAEFF